MNTPAAGGRHQRVQSQGLDADKFRSLKTSHVDSQIKLIPAVRADRNAEESEDGRGTPKIRLDDDIENKDH